MFDFLVSVFLGFRLRGSDEPYCINLLNGGLEMLHAAEVKRNREEKQGDKVLHSERYYGKVYRAFTLPQDVDEASAQAKYNDGVLELRLPKKSVTSAKKLSIQ